VKSPRQDLKPLFAGIEIGGTKLQAGVGPGAGQIRGLARTRTDPVRGADGIREALPALVEQALIRADCDGQPLTGLGIGFGGPVDTRRGTTVKSHQIQGWENVPLVDELATTCGCPVAMENDASIAGLAEAVLGAGQGRARIFYVTVGSGIGGGWIVNQAIDPGQGLGAGEIGHTWVPEPDTGRPEKLEHICSGWSLARRARRALEAGQNSLMSSLCDPNETLTAKTVYAAAARQDTLACKLLDDTCRTLALALGNVIALLHPERIIVGGGVSLMGPLFWDPLQRYLDDYMFAPYAGRCELVPAQLGEEVVVTGALLLAETLAEKECS
jgi:glucokinase